MASQKLTIKQKRFADEYIKHGNATRAAITAGYSKKTARFIASENLTKTYIKEYIAKRIEKLDAEKLLTQKEAMEITASIARGEPKTVERFSRDRETGETSTEWVREYPTFGDRQKSLEHFFRVTGAFVDKTELDIKSSEVEIVITGGDDDGED